MSAPQWHDRSLADMAGHLEAGDCTAVELAEHHLDRIAALEPSLNSLVTVDVDGALQAAEAADGRRRGGETGPLLGVPIIHKDLFCTRGLRTTCGSRMLADFVAPYDATVVERLRKAGTVMLAKANMDEFAMGSSNENSHFGAVANPWNLACIPGGSSGGSAAAVAAGLAAAATGTDTGGSIRSPAAYCGITGIKPTYGRVSRYGMIAFASSLDQGGVLARTASDCATMLQAMAGFDERDSTSSDQPVPDYSPPSGTPAASLEGIRLGVPEQYFGDGLEPRVRTAVEAAIGELANLGATIVPLTLPNQHLCIPAYYIVAPAEASSNLSRFDGVRFGHRCDDPTDLTDLYERSRAEGFGAEVQRRIMVGTYALSAGYYDAYYLKAQQVRRLISDDFRRAFEQVDVIAGPTTPDVAFTRGACSDDPVSMYLTDLYTVSANLAGLPGMSVPCGEADGLPVGLQLLGNYFDEATLLRVAHGYQQHTDWHARKPLLEAVPSR